MDSTDNVRLDTEDASSETVMSSFGTKEQFATPYTVGTETLRIESGSETPVGRDMPSSGIAYLLYDHLG